MRQGQPKWVVAGVAALAVATVIGVVAFVALYDPTPPDSGRAYPEPKTGVPTEPAVVPWKTHLDDVLPRLAKKNRPFTVALIGDSTGVDPKGWNVRLMDWLGKQTGRPWQVHAWHQKADQYGPPGYYPAWHYGHGDNAPITVWNASAGGKGWDYTAANEKKMFPTSLKDVDLLLINHGHNVRPSTDYYWEGYPLLDRMRERYPNAAVVMFKQNPEKGGSLTQTMLPGVFGQIDRYANLHPGVTVLDVHTMFEDTGKPETLIDDTNFHPTKPGYQMWFELVRDEFLKADPQLG